MKLNRIILTMIFPVMLLCIYLNLSCAKTFDSKFQTQSDFSSSTNVQLFMAMVNANRNYVYVDGKQVTGALMVSGSVFPSTGYGFNVDGGLRAFLVKDTLPTSTQAPLTFAENMQAGKSYSVFVYDTITSPKQKTVITDIIVPSDTSARLRFANFLYSPNALPNVDVYSRRRAANIFTNVAVTEVTSFIPFQSISNNPSNQTGSIDTIEVRSTGTTTNLAVFNGFNPTQKRSYTMILRGSGRAVGTTGKSLTLIVNY